MKRTPMTRKTPLLSRAALKPGKPLRRTVLRAVSKKRAAANVDRRLVVEGMRLLTNGICPRCGSTDWILHGHERLARAHGGDFIRPDVLLCNPCNGWCEDYPQTAAWTGWKVSASGKWPHDPDLGPTQALALNGTVVDFTVAAEAAS